MAEDLTQRGLVALGSPASRAGGQRAGLLQPGPYGKTNGGESISLLQITLLLNFNLGCESADVMRTKNKWAHYLKTKDTLFSVTLDDRKAQTGKQSCREPWRPGQGGRRLACGSSSPFSSSVIFSGPRNHRLRASAT